MKTKQLNRVLIIVATLMLMLGALVSFTACKKDFKPTNLTLEQATTAFDNAIAKAKTATNIYADAGNGQFIYADADGYYAKSIEDETGELYQETWYAYESSEWIGYFYYSYASGEVYNEYKTTMYDDATEATTNVEYFVNKELVTIQDDFDFANLTAKQTAKNVVEISIVEEDDGDELSIKIKIVDGYIKNVKMTATSGGDSEVYEQSYSYNVQDREIPELPNIEWTIW